MGLFILRRVGVMILTALCLTFVVFFLTNLYPNLEKLAKTQGNARMTDAEVASWLDRNGYGGPMIVRYGEWLGVVPGWTRRPMTGVITGPLHRPRHGPGRGAALLRAPAGRPGLFHRFRRRGGQHHRRPAAADRHPDVLGLRGDGSRGPARRGPRGHARGQPHGPKPVDLRHRLDRDAGIRVGRHLHRASGLLHRGPLALAGRKRLDRRTHAVPGLRPLGDGGRDQLLELHPAGVDHRALRHGLYRADDARLHGRGDDRAIHPHRAAQGRELQATSS
jgi:hypothetical protein